MMRIPFPAPLLLGLIAAAIPASLEAQDPAPTVVAPWDPTTTDPSPVNSEFPPAVVPVAIQSGGARLNGLIYLADGPGPHATVVFLADVPGHDSNLDLAQAVRRAGYNALVFHYRGTWGSGGDFTWDGAAEDASAVLDFLSSEEAGERLRTDAERLNLVGDGFGSWAALVAAAGHPAVGCVATLGAWNPAVRVGQAPGEGAGEAWRQSVAGATDPQGGPIRMGDPGDPLRQLMQETERFDLMGAAGGVREKSVLMITSSQGQADPAGQTMLLGASLAGAGAAAVEGFVISDDDDFSASRVRVARSLVTWLERQCPAW